MHAPTVAESTRVFMVSANRLARSLLRTMASWLMLRISSAASFTVTNAGWSVSK